MTPTNRFVALDRYAHGTPVEMAQFSVNNRGIPEPDEGELLLQTLVLSVDPYMRGCMVGIDTFYIPQFELGSPVYSLGVARVVKSRNPSYKTGDLVTGSIDWSDYSLWRDTGHPLGSLQLIPPGIDKLSHALGVFGLTGITAFFGVLGTAKPKRGETMLISGASGAVGSVAGQIAKRMGARVIGLAGTAEKCSVLVDVLGFDAAFDYHASDLPEKLGALMPHGPDIYFDNVGGNLSQTIMNSMEHRSRVIECGQISTYNDPGGGWTVDIRPIHSRGLSWESFTPMLFSDFIPGAVAQLMHWVRTKQIVALETEYRGLEELPRAMVGVLTGKNTGKMVVHLAD